MKTFLRFGYEDADGTLYVGSEDNLSYCNDDEKLRIMSEATFKKLMSDHRMRKRVYDAAMKFTKDDQVDFSEDNYEALEKACEKARGRTKR